MEKEKPIKNTQENPMQLKHILAILIFISQASALAADQSFLQQNSKIVGTTAVAVLGAITAGLASSTQQNQTTNETTDGSNTNYLYPPTGPYGVGYEDVHWTNQNVCPDVFFSGSNQYDFSVDNPQFCREMMARIYYPASEHTQHGSLYYPPIVKQWQLDLSGAPIPGVTEEQIDALSLIDTYTKQLAPLVHDKSFPVIIFNPGIDSNAEEYMNVISDIVSHGYIVVAINNTFISKAVEFPDSHIVLGITPGIPDSGMSKILDMTISDIAYAYQKIHELHNLDAVFSAMDLQHIGLLGHSLGGVATVKSAHFYPNWFQAAAALDAPYNPEFYDPLSGFEIPFLHMHAAHWSTTYPTADMFALTKNEYLMLLTPDRRDINYSRHNNFSDFSTLQYQPVVKAFNNYIPWSLDVGTMNGYEGISTINQYLIQFFDDFLKNKSSMIFRNCTSLAHTLMMCGPGQGKG